MVRFKYLVALVEITHVPQHQVLGVDALQLLPIMFKAIGFRDPDLLRDGLINEFFECLDSNFFK